MALPGGSYVSMIALTKAMSRRVLVSGGAGFVGHHLVARLKAEGEDVFAPAKEELDLCDGDTLREMVREVTPSSFFHLAAFSSPALSWERPREALIRNVQMTLNVLEAVRHESPETLVVLTGSGQVYGEPDALPATEDTPLRPTNPYAVSKATCDMLGRQYAEGYKMRVVRMRLFNHAGPGQSEDYVVSSLAHQIAEAEIAGRDECVLRTGNPEAARDFTDVRDAVRASIMAAEIGLGAFNVCSGSATSVAELVEMASAQTHIQVRHKVDPTLFRSQDDSVLYGSHERLTATCRWRPEIHLDQTMQDTLEWWREQLARKA